MPYSAAVAETIDTGIDYSHVGRGVGVLSDGYVVLLVQDRAESFQKLELYYHPGTGTGAPTSAVDHTVSASAQTRVPFSMVVDGSDNIHVAFCVDQTTVKYVRFDKGAGHTWTVGVSNETAFTPGSIVWKVAIANLDDPDSVIITATRMNGTTATLYYAVRDTAGTWRTPVTHTLDNTGWGFTSGVNGTAGEAGFLSVSENIAGATSNVQQCLIAVCPSAYSKSVIYGVEVNISTGAEVTWKTIDGDFFLPAGTNSRTWFEQIEIFATASGEWTIGAVSGSGAQARGWVAKSAWAGYTISPQQVNLQVAGPDGVTPTITFPGLAAFARARAINYVSGRIVLHYTGKVGSNWFVFTRLALIVGTSAAFGPHHRSAGLSANEIRDMVGGANRNFAQLRSPYQLQSWNTGITTASRYLILNEPTFSPVVTNGKPSGGTQNTNRPVIGGKITQGTYDSRLKLQAKLATDSGLTANLRTQTFPDSALTTNGQISEYTLDNVNKLFQGTWYMRLCYVDEYGVLGDNYALAIQYSFTVSHPPTASSLSPSAGSIQLRATSPGNRFSWVFGDTSPDNTQSAFQVVIERNSDGAAIHDSGKVTSTNKYYDYVVPSGNIGQMLRWKVRVWDSEDVVGSYSPYSLAQFNTAPTVSGISLGGTNIPSPSPTVTWTYTAGTAGAQAKYQVLLQDYNTGLLVYDSGIITSPTASHTVPSALHPLIKNDHYNTWVIVWDGAGIQGAAIDINRLATWTSPAQPVFSIDTANYAANGAVVITWDDDDQDANWVAWRVYRRQVEDGNVWQLIVDRRVTAAVMTAVDILARSQQPHDYIVTQVKSLGGIEVESDFTTVHSATPETDGYHITDPALQGTTYTSFVASGLTNFRIEHVTEDSFGDEIEEAVMTLVGRGRHRDVGTTLGVTGQITAQLYGLGQNLTPRQERLLLEQLRESGEKFVFKNPFGDVWHLMLGQLSFARLAGVGSNEYTTVTIPYMETT